MTPPTYRQQAALARLRECASSPTLRVVAVDFVVWARIADVPELLAAAQALARARRTLADGETTTVTAEGESDGEAWGL